MCLLVNNIDKDARVAGKPITVYKILKKYADEFFTPYQNVVCEIGDTLKGRLTNNCLNYETEIGSAGVHAYKSLLAARHSSFASSDGEFNDYVLYITEWEIPKGARYWNGVKISYLEIAATEMKFVKVIEEFDKSKLTYLLAPDFGINNRILKFATHYITDEGEVITIEEAMKLEGVMGIDDWRLAWVIDDIKKLVPQHITKDNVTYDLFIDFNKTNWCCYAGYRIKDDKKSTILATLFNYVTPTFNMGYIYGQLLSKLIHYEFLK